MKKKIGAFGAGQFSLGTLVGGRPGTTIFQNPGGGGGLGGVAYNDRARPPPPCQQGVAGCTIQVPGTYKMEEMIRGNKKG